MLIVPQIMITTTIVDIIALINRASRNQSVPLINTTAAIMTGSLTKQTLLWFACLSVFCFSILLQLRSYKMNNNVCILVATSWEFWKVFSHLQQISAIIIWTFFVCFFSPEAKKYWKIWGISLHRTSKIWVVLNRHQGNHIASNYLGCVDPPLCHALF